jgi:Spy/CpxP family protein refolding chaperone
LEIMKARYAIIGAALFAVVAAGTLQAQDDPPPPVDRPMRLHAPGTGLDQGPAMRQRMGRRAGGLAGGQRYYAPQFLAAQRQLLGLTDEQISQLETLGAEGQAEREQELEQARTSQEALHEAWQADQPDPDAIRRHAQATMEAHQRIQLDLLDRAARAKALLTPTQQGKLQGWVEGRRMSRGGRGMRGERGHRGQRGGLGMRRACPGGTCR